MKTNQNLTGDTSPSAVNLLHDLKKMAEPTVQEEHLCYVHRHEIPAILAGLKYGNKIGKYVLKTPKTETENMIISEEPPKTRTCTVCGEEKLITEFAKADKKYFRNVCKKCYSRQKATETKRRREKMKELTKICTHCGKEKSIEEYQIDRRGKLGRKSVCKECANAQKRETRANLKTCTPQPLKKEFDTENFKKYLMYQIEVTKSMVQKLQGKIETYQELIGEL